jgi:hypothetical protein
VRHTAETPQQEMQLQVMDWAGSLRRIVPKAVFAAGEARQRAIQEFIAGSVAQRCARSEQQQGWCSRAALRGTSLQRQWQQ